jgi:DNA ligase 1
MLVTEWENSMEPEGWLLSEKFDGVRALWNGASLYSRMGRILCPPSSFFDALPPFSLDGELW